MFIPEIFTVEDFVEKLREQEELYRDPDNRRSMRYAYERLEQLPGTKQFLWLQRQLPFRVYWRVHYEVGATLLRTLGYGALRLHFHTQHKGLLKKAGTVGEVCYALSSSMDAQLKFMKEMGYAA